MAHPAGQRRRGLVRPAGGDVQESRRAGAAVEVLVPAAHREIGVRARQVHRQGARGMREVPDRQRPRAMRRRGQGGHVVAAAGAVVHLGQHQDGDVGREGGFDLLGGHDAQLPAQRVRQAAGDVEVGGEVAGVREDHPTVRAQGQRRRQHLEQVHRGRVPRPDRGGVRADQRGDPGADPPGEVDPAAIVPAADQAGAPFGLHRLRHPGGHVAGQRAQRVAVQVDHPLRQVEHRAGAGEKVGVGHGGSCGGRAPRVRRRESGRKVFRSETSRITRVNFG